MADTDDTKGDAASEKEPAGQMYIRLHQPDVWDRRHTHCIYCGARLPKPTEPVRDIAERHGFPAAPPGANQDHIDAITGKGFEEDRAAQSIEAERDHWMALAMEHCRLDKTCGCWCGAHISVTMGKEGGG